MKHLLGAHVGVSKGLVAAVEKAHTMGANCMQLFASPPQSFAVSKFADTDCLAFAKKTRELAIKPIFIHATYLINLGSEKSSLIKASIACLVDDLTIAEKIGAVGSIVHTGSHKGKGLEAALPTVVEAVKSVLKQTPVQTRLLLEIASGGGGKIGSTFEELQQILDKIDSSRVGVCLDSCHMFAAGYAFDTPEKIEELSHKIGKTVGWDRVWCMHANDSKFELGSFRDRHENIGKGFVGKKAFNLLLKHPKFGKLPFILETPGFDDKGPDKQNLDILKSLV